MGKKLEPTHPGEILLEEFMKPLDISINVLPVRLRSLPLESVRSSTASGVSLLTQHCVWADIFPYHPMSGWAFRMNKIYALPDRLLARNWKSAYILTRPDEINVGLRCA